MSVRGCALGNAGACTLVYSALGSPIAAPSLADRAWITLGLHCEKGGPACARVDQRREAIFFERACHRGDGSACREAAGQLPDPERQARLLARACSLGDCESCVGGKTVEGLQLAEQRGSLARAAATCPAECRAAVSPGPEPKACRLGLRALTSLGGSANERKALAVAEAQCRRGFTCDVLAQLFVVSALLTPADEKRVGAVLASGCRSQRPGTCAAPIELAQVKPARAKCRAGDVDACVKLGEQLTLSSVELPQIGAAWARGCKLGSNLACVRHWAALVSASSHDQAAIDVSHQKAAAACEGGDLQICIELANHLEFRAADLAEFEGVAQRVVEQLGSRCSAGNGESCERAATFLQFKKQLDGEARAKDFLRQACEHGQAARCVELAEEKVKQKLFVSAAQLGAKGCEAGSPTGCQIFARYRLELTPDALAAGDRALGLACGKNVEGACALAADEGITTTIVAPERPIPVN